MAKQHRNYRSRFKTQRTGTAEFFSYTLITGGNFYGIKVGNSIDDFLNFDQRTSSTPSVIINGNTAVLDFSASQTQKDLNYLKAMSDTLTSGNTFTITHGEYYDPNTEQYADISGTYTFEGMFRDTVIKATFDTLQNVPTGVVRYSSDFFADVPQIDLLGTASTGREHFFLKNYLGTESSPSFTSIGTRVRDYITIADSTINNKAFRVEDFYLDPNGTEVVILGATAAIEEDRIGTTSDIKLYRDQRSDTERVGAENADGGIHADTRYLNIEILKVTVGRENDDYYYMINGVREPNLTLTRGITYIIDQTDPSNYRGPNNNNLLMRLVKVREGTFNRTAAQGSTESIFVSDGVTFPNTEANMFIFEPRFYKNSLVYFYCPNKNGMGGSFNISGVYSIYSTRVIAPASQRPEYRFTNGEQDRQLRTANAISFAQIGNSAQDFRRQAQDNGATISFESNSNY